MNINEHCACFDAGSLCRVTAVTPQEFSAGKARGALEFWLPGAGHHFFWKEIETPWKYLEALTGWGREDL